MTEPAEKPPAVTEEKPKEKPAEPAAAKPEAKAEEKPDGAAVWRGHEERLARLEREEEARKNKSGKKGLLAAVKEFLDSEV